MTVLAIIQARMGSTRLPGKILKQVNGKALLAYQLERVGQSKCIDKIVIATTIDQKDEPIVEFCEQYGVDYYRGSENDVLARYYEAAQRFDGDIIVRLTSDCPIIDPVVIDETI
ncbi:MAG: NTP transferase domain-containing protein, partial [Psychrobacillus psychrodurans]